jgi:hypothetical protein
VVVLKEAGLNAGTVVRLLGLGAMVLAPQSNGWQEQCTGMASICAPWILLLCNDPFHIGSVGVYTFCWCRSGKKKKNTQARVLNNGYFV